MWLSCFIILTININIPLLYVNKYMFVLRTDTTDKKWWQIVLMKLEQFANKYIYVRKKNYMFSARIVCTVTVGALCIYQVRSLCSYPYEDAVYFPCEDVVYLRWEVIVCLTIWGRCVFSMRGFCFFKSENIVYLPCEDIVYLLDEEFAGSVGVDGVDDMRAL